MWRQRRQNFEIVHAPMSVAPRKDMPCWEHPHSDCWGQSPHTSPQGVGEGYGLREFSNYHHSGTGVSGRWGPNCNPIGWIQWIRRIHCVFKSKRTGKVDTARRGMRSIVLFGYSTIQISYLNFQKIQVLICSVQFNMGLNTKPQTLNPNPQTIK